MSKDVRLSKLESCCYRLGRAWAVVADVLSCGAERRAYDQYMVEEHGFPTPDKGSTYYPGPF